ncbi:hypothetical protein ST37_10110 [Vibrio sp. qd031]|uniref:hypothetical protein n=1 Tax=Vibrio sp. qd031 TaxID=1603038 RepID=UPI000A104342|nr:hypothetical protein [Vibrio sp. qd031]ORT50240.1 hypothetical protein ST37_10110 [Vibrio sp. qd031]
MRCIIAHFIILSVMGMGAASYAMPIEKSFPITMNVEWTEAGNRIQVVPGENTTDFNHGVLQITETTRGTYEVLGQEMDFRVEEKQSDTAWVALDTFEYTVQRVRYAYGESNMLLDDRGIYRVVVNNIVAPVGEAMSYSGHGRTNVPIYVESTHEFTDELEAGTQVAVSATLLVTLGTL